MSRYKLAMKKRSGLAIGLAILLMISIMVMGLYLLLQYFPFMTKIVGIDYKVNLLIEVEDKGSKIAGFLQAREHNISYAEVLGDFRARNHSGNIREEVEALEETLEKLDLKIAVYNESGGVVYGSASGKTVDIALPGGLKGGLGIE
jgi:hypothetical protein